MEVVDHGMAARPLTWIRLSLAAWPVWSDMSAWGLWANADNPSRQRLFELWAHGRDVDMAKGWLIGIMVEVEDEPIALRHFFAVGHDDRAKAEWTAIDEALLIGQVAMSPVGGLEPVQAIGELSAKTVALQGLKPGEVRALGRRPPRRWMPVAATSGSRDRSA